MVRSPAAYSTLYNFGTQFNSFFGQTSRNYVRFTRRFGQAENKGKKLHKIVETALLTSIVCFLKNVSIHTFSACYKLHQTITRILLTLLSSQIVVDGGLWQLHWHRIRVNHSQRGKSLQYCSPQAHLQVEIIHASRRIMSLESEFVWPKVVQIRLVCEDFFNFSMICTFVKNTVVARARVIMGQSTYISKALKSLVFNGFSQNVLFSGFDLFFALCTGY